MNKIEVYKINKYATLPTRNHSYDAGVDLYSLVDMFIPLGKTRLIPTGVAIHIEDGYVGIIGDRSSMALKGLRSGAGVIDAKFTGEIGIVLHNLNNESQYDNVFSLGKLGYKVNKGDRIAQLIVYKCETPPIVEVQELWSSQRGSKGFGSSGL